MLRTERGIVLLTRKCVFTIMQVKSNDSGSIEELGLLSAVCPTFCISHIGCLGYEAVILQGKALDTVSIWKFKQEESDRK